MKAALPSGLCLCPGERGSNVLLFRGYSQHLETKTRFPARDWDLCFCHQQAGNPCSTTVPPAGKRRSSVHLPSHVLLSSLPCQQQHSHSLWRAEAGNQSSNLLWKTSPHLPRTHWFSMRSGAWRQGCIFLQHFRLKSARTLWAFFQHTLGMAKPPLFHRALLKARKRWQHKERLQAVPTWSTTTLRGSSMDGQTIHYLGTWP